MSFAGHVFDMIARMKANERRKRRPFDKEVNVPGQKVRPEYLRKATGAQIREVQERIRSTRKREKRVELIVIACCLGILIVLIWLL